MKTTVVQKTIVLNGGKLLALRRSKTDARRPLQWDLPGGMLDEGETQEAGAVREVVEETGLTITSPKLLFAKSEVRTFKKSPDTEELTENVVFLFYSAKSNGSDPKISYEHSEFRWMTFEEALKEFQYPLHLEALRYISDNDIT